MLENTDKSITEIYLDAASQKGTQTVGETVDPLMKELNKIIEDCVQKQYEVCSKKGFWLPKYYLHIFIVKDLMAARIYNTPNVVRVRRPHCRVTRPSPYQEEDHYLWSVENMDHITFLWCIPNKETINYILSNPNEFDESYVQMLRRYTQDTLETLEDYEVQGVVQ